MLLGTLNPVTVRDPLSGAPFAGNIVPASRLSPLSVKVNEKYLPAPNRGGPSDLANNYSFVFPFSFDYTLRRDMTQRIDHQLTSKNRLMGRLIENWDYYVRPNTFDTFTYTQARWNFHLVLEDTHVFSPSLVNTFRVGLYQSKLTNGESLYGVTPFKGDAVVKELGLQGVNPQGLSAMGFPQMSIAGYPTLTMPAGGVAFDDRDWGYADTATWAKGRHVIKVGGEFKPQHRLTANVPVGTYGNFAFNGNFTGYGYADFLLGIPYNSTRLDPLTNRRPDDNEFGVFAMDDFKVNSRLTLNLGVRCDRFGSPALRDGLMWNWDLASGAIVIPSEAKSKVSPLYPKNIPIVTGQVRQNPDMKNFVPRVGGAYRPFGGNMVIRGGYGIYNETLGRYSRLNTGGPFEISETYVNALQGGQPLFAFPNPFPASLAGATIPSQNFTGYPLDSKNGQIHQFNVTAERQIRDIGVRLSYVGSRGRNLNYDIGINKPEPSLIAFTQARRPWPQFVGGTYSRHNGASNFNAVTLQAQRKVGGLTFDGHWTRASNYDNMQNFENPYGTLGFAHNQFTSRHRGVLNVTWEIPVGRKRKFLSRAPAAINEALGGWQIYWIAYFETGRYFTPKFAGSDPSNTNTVGGLPDRVCNGNLPAGERTISHWFDYSCFAVPPKGRFGNSGSNILEAPGFHMHHISLAKQFDLTERFKFNLTVAASNAMNHPNFGSPSANISAPGNLGIVSGLRTQGTPRRIELRGRIDF